jgi:hypothetical protein
MTPNGELPELQVFQAANLEVLLAKTMSVECPAGCWLAIYLDLPDVLGRPDLTPELAEAWGYFAAGLERKLRYRAIVSEEEAAMLFRGIAAVGSPGGRGAATPRPPYNIT